MLSGSLLSVNVSVNWRAAGVCCRADLSTVSTVCPQLLKYDSLCSSHLSRLTSEIKYPQVSGFCVQETAALTEDKHSQLPWRSSLMSEGFLTSVFADLLMSTSAWMSVLGWASQGNKHAFSFVSDFAAAQKQQKQKWNGSNQRSEWGDRRREGGGAARRHSFLLTCRSIVEEAGENNRRGHNMVMLQY